MIIQQSPPLHLTYCLKIHPGESWAENLAALQEKTTAVKRWVAPDAWFGAGLRIAPDKLSRTNLAIDVGFREKSMGIYFGAAEVF